MKKEIEVPEVGESVSEGVLAVWLKRSGEHVDEGDEIFELETDKATLSVPSPASGVLETSVEADSEVEVGQTVGYIDTEVTSAAGGSPGGAPGHDESGEEPASGPADAEKPGAAVGNGASHEAPHEAFEGLSPAVRRMVAEHELNPDDIEGTGKGGRITTEDVTNFLESDKKAGESRAEAAPARGTAAQASTSSGGSSGAEALAAGERQTRKPLSKLRKKVAANLVAAQANAAHLTTFNEVDMSAVMDTRKRYKEAFEKKHGVRLGFMSFFVKASQKALETFPKVNAFLEGDEVVYNNFYDVGVALSTDRGLMTPVIRDVQTKSFADIESEILSFATRAKEKKLRPDELIGGTFTITNGGVFGSMLSTPIPNPPQTGILGMHSIQERPMAVEGQVVIRPMMYLALTYDHRMIDGREAIRFLVRIKELIEDPNQILLDL
jgi:2-oxoglutarate dehydrogenase E2 component (dihydrolipoamide succinyltransferase)